MEKKQTAVEWLIEQVNGKGLRGITFVISNDTFEKAKQMEKDQICDAWIAGLDPMNTRTEPESSDEYYTRIYATD